VALSINVTMVHTPSPAVFVAIAHFIEAKNERYTHTKKTLQVDSINPSDFHSGGFKK